MRLLRYRVVKTWLDFGFALVLMVPLAPIMALLAILIRLDSRGPALFRQIRVGACGQPFTIWKFRTMRIGTPTLSTEEMQLQAYNPITRVGRILRKTNLDELPQIFNILYGEMSFIGPRPALPSQTDVNDLRAETGADRARPGITGLSQVRGRDDLDTPTKVAFDAQYCRTMSLALDTQILFLTIGAVLSGRGNK